MAKTNIISPSNKPKNANTLCGLLPSIPSTPKTIASGPHTIGRTNKPSMPQIREKKAVALVVPSSPSADDTERFWIACLTGALLAGCGACFTGKAANKGVFIRTRNKRTRKIIGFI